MTSAVFAGPEGAEEREETGDAAGVVGLGAVAESIVFVGGAAVEEGAAVACPNIFDIRLVNIPIKTQSTLCRKKLPVASRLSNCRLLEAH